jgi:hypothetical protein
MIDMSLEGHIAAPIHARNAQKPCAMKSTRLLIALSLLIFVEAAFAAPQSELCGLKPDDWCPGLAGDPCGRHRTAAACRSDPVCYGMPYQGESVVACNFDRRGFSENCPTVGCTSSPPRR